MSAASRSITASDVAALLSPSRCERRVVLEASGEQRDPATALREVLRDEGIAFEHAVLEGLSPRALELSDGSEHERAEQAIAAVADGVAHVYQPLLKGRTEILGETWELKGIPDLLVIDDGGQYRIRDVKLLTNLEAHPEVTLQLQFYGLLYQQTFGAAPAGLEVHCGDGSIQVVPPAEGAELAEVIERVALLMSDGEQSHEPRGVSKCGQCGFRMSCYDTALEHHDVSLVSGVSQVEARAFYAAGIFTAEDLAGNSAEAVAAALGDDQGDSDDRARAARLLLGAEAMAGGESVVVSKPELPATRELIMFDVEDTGYIADTPVRVLLWGLRGYDAAACDYIAVEGGFDEQADRAGWFAFLGVVDEMMTEHEDARFVHWSSHEGTKLDQYVERYGDPEGIAQRLDGALFDLLPVARGSIIPPTPGFSLKSIEKVAGYQRSLEGRDGSWAMAKYRLAARGDGEIDLQEVNDYNEEDLEATWAVMVWMEGLTL